MPISAYCMCRGSLVVSVLSCYVITVWLYSFIRATYIYSVCQKQQLRTHILTVCASDCYHFSLFYPHYVRVFAIANPSVCRLSVCNICAPYSGSWSFRQNCLLLCTLPILWPPCKILLRSFQGNPSVGGIKRKRGIKIERWWTYRRLYLINGTRYGLGYNLWLIGNDTWV